MILEDGIDNLVALRIFSTVKLRTKLSLSYIQKSIQTVVLVS